MGTDSSDYGDRELCFQNVLQLYRLHGLDLQGQGQGLKFGP